MKNLYTSLTSPTGGLLASCLLLILSFPQANLWPLGWVYLVPLLVSVHKNRTGSVFKTALLSFVFGVGCYLYIFSGIPGNYNILFYLILVVYAAVFEMLLIVGYHFIVKYSKLSLPLKLIFISSLAAVLEFLKTLGPSFPATFNITQTVNALVLPIVEYTGYYGITFLMVFMNTLLGEVVIHRKKLKQKARKLLPVFSILFIIVLVAFIKKQFSENTGNNVLNIGVLQGNISIDEYRHQKYEEKIKQTYYKLFTQVPESSKLVIFPEESLMNVKSAQHKYVKKLMNIAFQKNQYILLSIQTQKQYKKETYNSMLLLAENKVKAYHKNVLLPLAENDMTPGEHFGAVLGTKNFQFAPNICFESLYPQVSRQAVKKGAQFIVVSSNDVGLGQIILPELHLKYAIFRAIENNRYIVHASQGGPSAVIDNHGQIVKKLKAGVSNILNAKVHLKNDKTFYTQFGDVFIGICILFLVFIVGYCKKYQ